MRLRRVLKWLAVVSGLLLAGAAMTFYLLFERGRRGPDLRYCQAPVPARVTFEKPIQVTTSAGPGRYQTEVSAALLPSGTVAIAAMARTSAFADGELVTATVSPEGEVQLRPFRGDRKQHYDPWL